MLERSDAPGAGAMSEALSVITCWVETLHGRGDVLSALDLIVGLVNGQQGVLLRLQLDVAAQTTIAQVDRGRAVGRPPGESLSFSQYLLGHGIGQAQPGSLWFLSEVAPELAGRDGAGERMALSQHPTREIVAAVLEPRQRTSDIVEIYFTRRLSGRESEMLGIFMGIASRAWRHRNGSVFSAAEAERTITAPPLQPAPRGSNILDPGNPAGLSRSEYRVCALVCRGMNARRISNSLQISESTVRSHLRSIYSKTHTNGHAELIYRLLGRQADQVLPLALADGGGSPARAGQGVRRSAVADD